VLFDYLPREDLVASLKHYDTYFKVRLLLPYLDTLRHLTIAAMKTYFDQSYSLEVNQYLLPTLFAYRLKITPARRMSHQFGAMPLCSVARPTLRLN